MSNFLPAVYQISKHTHLKQWSVWSKLPDVPYSSSSVCAVDGVLLAIGGTESKKPQAYRGSKKTPAIYAFYHVDLKWHHVGDMPFECWRVDTLQLSDGRLLIVDGISKKVLKIKVDGTCIRSANESAGPATCMQAEQRYVHSENIPGNRCQ